MFGWRGNRIGVSIFGASHAKEIGVVMDGFPKEDFDFEKLLAFLSRRKAVNSVFSTARKEDDLPIFESGVQGDKIVDDNIKAIIVNNNVKSTDYDNLYAKPRPSHADFAAHCLDGRLDFSGGGEFSGRMTAPLCIAGGIAKQMLEKRGIYVDAYISQIGNVKGKSYKTHSVAREEICQMNGSFALENADKMLEEIAEAKAHGDSVGGVVECLVTGMKAGIGGALFEGLESKIAYLIYAIPAVKGVEFGDGFDFGRMRGSNANDAWQYEKGVVKALTNHAGGINGGISNGMPITLSVAFRPTPSIAIEQDSVDLIKKENVKIKVGGRHDACIVPRALPVVESAVALAILDCIL